MSICNCILIKITSSITHLVDRFTCEVKCNLPKYFTVINILSNQFVRIFYNVH